MIRRSVEERLGNGATYKATLIEPIESRVEEMWRAAADRPNGLSVQAENLERSGDIAVGGRSLELRLMIERLATQHWESWFDLPVPALNDMTPREAAKTEAGRELLESLLLLYESLPEYSLDKITAPDVPALRQELGMD